METPWADQGVAHGLGLRRQRKSQCQEQAKLRRVFSCIAMN
ncbi:hypothetical protein XBKQ1_970019 [Xenorhabdus bovienii str. kraussei Quebec]|uniref:Uncharacterized protein n=1 Tax=Xenorhabdus bovienii str. kraussei Quebec TaxID=1398203 RepID=A0A077PM58_XENBV|nr:hypothetical protein XBKQ1_970019 [Xenorhabdus bovienii str. kraussei Quebec]